MRRQEDGIRTRRLWEANQKWPMDLIKEMKNVKAANKARKLPDTVEGKDTEEDIVEEFGKVYLKMILLH